MVVLGLFFLNIVVMFITQCQSNDDTLELIIAVFRHGDRTNDKITVYPKDPYFNYTYYPYGYGHLTNAGKQRLYNLGKKLRKRYETFLDPLYTPDLLYATSTAVCRTKTSLSMLLAGLFPPVSTALEWDAHLNWSPIPFTYNEQITHIPPFMFCPEYKQLYKSYLQHDEVQTKLKKYKKWFPYLSYHMGLEVKSYSHLIALYYHLKIQEENGMKVPLWTFPVYPHILRNASIDIFYSFSATKELKQLYGGKFVKILVNVIQEEINKTSNKRKLYLYSGHDLNVLATLYALNVENFYNIPSYGACVLLEVHKKKNKYFVKIFYEDYTLDEIKQLNVKGCSKECSFDQFLNLITENFPTDDSLCNQMSGAMDPLKKGVILPKL